MPAFGINDQRARIVEVAKVDALTFTRGERRDRSLCRSRAVARRIPVV